MNIITSSMAVKIGNDFKTIGKVYGLTQTGWTEQD